MEPTSTKKFWKIDVEKQHVLGDDFFSNFRRFGIRKWSQHRPFFVTFSKTSILQKSCSRRGESSIFQVSSVQKSKKNRCQNALQNNFEKNAQKSSFCVNFGFPKPRKSTRKATQNEARFATLWKPPGTRRKLTGIIVCKASKWLGIWLGLLHPLI